MSRNYYWILEGQEPRPSNRDEWSTWFESHDRTLHRTPTSDGEVSTVFLGLDHQYGEGPPLIFETLVFGGSFDGEMERYSTWEEAEAGHILMVARVIRGRE